MKHLFVLSLCLMPFSVSAAKSTADFGKALLDDMKVEVSKDDGAYKKAAPSRAPASLPASPMQLDHEQKQNEKLNKNLNQIGKPTW